MASDNVSEGYTSRPHWAVVKSVVRNTVYDAPILSLAPTSQLISPPWQPCPILTCILGTVAHITLQDPTDLLSLTPTSRSPGSHRDEEWSGHLQSPRWLPILLVAWCLIWWFENIENTMVICEPKYPYWDQVSLKWLSTINPNFKLITREQSWSVPTFIHAHFLT